MAKRAHAGEMRNEVELPLDVLDSAATSSAGPSAGGLIEYDFSKPFSAQAGSDEAVTLQSADTIIPHADLFKARDELEAMFGGTQERVSAQSATTVEPGDKVGLENIVGFGVTLRSTAGVFTGEVAATVLVREKLPKSRIDPIAFVEPQISHIPTDVQAVGEILPSSYAYRYNRQVRCGVSVGNVGPFDAGTLGCLVEMDDGKLCLLSCNHVIADQNQAAIGSFVLQPGRLDTGNANDAIATLLKYVPIAQAGNLVDAAVAWTHASKVTAEFMTYQLPNPATEVTATLGLTVMKNGRTTQSTVGTVTGVGMNVSVPYKKLGFMAQFKDQIQILGLNGSVFSSPGDSGSLVVTQGSKNPVGMVFAGGGTTSYANPIVTVRKQLGIKRILATL